MLDTNMSFTVPQRCIKAVGCLALPLSIGGDTGIENKDVGLSHSKQRTVRGNEGVNWIVKCISITVHERVRSNRFYNSFNCCFIWSRWLSMCLYHILLLTFKRAVFVYGNTVSRQVNAETLALNTVAILQYVITAYMNSIYSLLDTEKCSVSRQYLYLYSSWWRSASL